jgi:hypothetical protein
MERRTRGGTRSGAGGRDHVPMTPQEFEVFYIAEYPKLVKFLMVRMMASFAEAEDAVQEALGNFFRRSKTGEVADYPVKLARHGRKPGAGRGVRSPAPFGAGRTGIGDTPPPRLRRPVLAGRAICRRPRLRADGNGALRARSDACRTGMGDRGPAAAAGPLGGTCTGWPGRRDDSGVPGRVRSSSSEGVRWPFCVRGRSGGSLQARSCVRGTCAGEWMYPAAFCWPACWLLRRADRRLPRRLRRRRSMPRPRPARTDQDSRRRWYRAGVVSQRRLPPPPGLPGTAA